ncbi:hypothetical protein [uncultured Maribacter sp.]|uniref:hypothetical protein n=1 Tax=uncultured Maribacter sp. TaxID=431308 RepID=UPI002613D6D0|nr:hypothetical protein [uncultured Maribacter sp.]
MIKPIHFLLFFIFFICSCSNDDSEPVAIKSDSKEIIDFFIDGIDTEIDGNIIKIYVPASRELNRFLPQIKSSEKSEVFPKLNIPIDFTNPVNFVVKAEDASINNYTTELITLNGLESITMILKSDDGNTGVDKFHGEIDELEEKIYIYYSSKSVNGFKRFDYFPYLDIKMTNNEETIPTLNDIIDISNKNQKLYIPSLNKSYDLIIKNEDNLIERIYLPLTTYGSFSQLASSAYDEFRVGLDDNDYIFHTLKNQDLTNLKPDSILISDYATITPDLSTPQDFSKDVTYTITSETGVEKTRKIRVIEKNIIFPNDTSNAGSVSNNTTWFDRYIATSKVIAITLVNRETNETLACQIIENYETTDGDTYLILEIDEMPLTRSSYYYRCTLEEGITVDSYGGIGLDPDKD